jgi:hypothetical protein
MSIKSLSSFEMVGNAVRDLYEAFTLRQGENRKGLTRTLMKPTPQVVMPECNSEKLVEN